MTTSRNGFGVAVLGLLMTVGLSACSLMPPAGFPRADYVDIEQFMGPWYVIAHVPPSKTQNAYNALECYERIAPGVIATTFTYQEGSFDGKRHTMKPTGYVIKGTGNAIWGMQFFWPIKMQYVLTYVSDDYDTAIVARSDRDYAWILARTPRIPASTYADLVDRVAALGYDMSQLRKVPQQLMAQRSVSCQQPPKGGGSEIA